MKKKVQGLTGVYVCVVGCGKWSRGGALSVSLHLTCFSSMKHPVSGPGVRVILGKIYEYTCIQDLLLLLF